MNTMNSSELKPFIYLALNFAIGALVANGYVDGSVKDQVIQEAANFIGLIIVLATSGVTLWRVIKHPHTNTNTTTLTVKNDTLPPVVLTAPQLTPTEIPVFTPEANTPTVSYTNIPTEYTNSPEQGV